MYAYYELVYQLEDEVCVVILSCLMMGTMRDRGGGAEAGIAKPGNKGVVISLGLVGWCGVVIGLVW
jgi:hypothetical protein